MIRVLSVFGTRPEAIKMAPVVKALERERGSFQSLVCATAQHREMLDQVLEVFDIVPDVDLNLMRPGQSLHELTATIVRSMSKVYRDLRPHWVLVQGDTTTVMGAALAAFYQRIYVGHVEAGLRTGDRYSPFPEEINRRLTSELAELHFAPTARAKRNLLRESIPLRKVFLTGNTVVDALHMVLELSPSQMAIELLKSLGMDQRSSMPSNRKIVLVTAHRRESFGMPFESLCKGLRALADRNAEILIVYPVHLNPQVRAPVQRLLSGHPRIRLIEPVSYEPFVRLLNAADLVVTDSGGIQEESAILGKPVLVLREVTERPEIIEEGIGALVGTDEGQLLEVAESLLHGEEVRRRMSRKLDVFGKQGVSSRIVEILRTASKERDLM